MWGGGSRGGGEEGEERGGGRSMDLRQASGLSDKSINSSNIGHRQKLYFWKFVGYNLTKVKFLNF